MAVCVQAPKDAIPTLQQMDQDMEKNNADLGKMKISGSDRGAAFSPSGSASTSSYSSNPNIQPGSKQAALMAEFDANQREEDEQLDELGNVLGVLKEQSMVIQKELQHHDQILTQIDGKVDETSARLKKGSRTMQKIT